MFVGDIFLRSFKNRSDFKPRMGACRLHSVRESPFPLNGVVVFTFQCFLSFRKYVAPALLGFCVLASFQTALAAPAGGESVQISGVPATAQKIPLKVQDEDRMSSLKSVGGDFSYVITFGKLTQQQFASLVAYFKVGDGAQLDPQRIYSLEDFLPAKMQALVYRRLEMSSRSVESLMNVDLFYKNNGEIVSAVNCWGTAWEMVRDSSAKTPFMTFMASRRYVQTVLQSPEFSTEVSVADGHFGDMSLFLAKNELGTKLQHAAIFVGSGFYFERTDSGSEMFFRIVKLEEMTERLKKTFENYYNDIGEPQRIEIVTELRRFGTSGAKPLPTAAEQFSVKSSPDKTYQEYADALPSDINKAQVSLFADDRLGGGDEVNVVDMVPVKIRIHPTLHRGEIDPSDAGASRFVKSN